ncbi:hypothetical protein BH11PLA1_BH11PLA1_04160 [soil metagenome]
MLTGALLIGGGVLTGCNIVAPALLIVNGPPKVNAQYELDSAKTFVVFIDDPHSLLPSRDVRVQMGRACEEDLLTRGLVKDMVKSSAVLPLVRGEKRSELLSIEQVGAKVNAQGVIYAAITQFTLSADGTQYAPAVTMEVKVVDVATGSRLFPPEDSVRETFTLSMIEPNGQGDPPTTRAALLQVQQSIAQRAGVMLARMFYDAERQTPRTRREDAARP